MTPDKIIRDKLKFYNADCMEIMAQYPDGYFDLAVVDPPYGIEITKQRGFGTLNDKKKKWDDSIPKKEYFDELFRVSKNQIIWGGNYFLNYLKSTKCCLIWDKMNGTNDMADFEFCWTSFLSPCRKFSMHHFSCGYDKKIHPTQKPVALYRWIYDNYAQPGMKILDTHGGSFSNAIAAHYFGVSEFVGIELDKDYFNDAMKRIERETKQLTIFDQPKQDNTGTQLTIES